MNKSFSCKIFIIACLLVMYLLSGCNSTSNINDFYEDTMKDCYKIEDFQSITIGKSTYQDVFKIAYTESMQITSYGGVCEYPSQNGKRIRIKFYGKELIVGAIEEITLSAEAD